MGIGVTRTIRGAPHPTIPPVSVASTDPFTEMVLRFYQEAAPLYDDWADGVHRKAAARLAQLAAVQPGEFVVDAGCGTGLLANSLAGVLRTGGRVVGIDLSPAMLEVAEAHRPADAPVAFGHGVVEQLVPRSKTVDVVVLGLVLSYTKDPEVVLREARRVLRPGGRVVISEYRPSLVTEVDEIFYAELRDLADVVFRVPERGLGHHPFGEPAVLERILEGNGFGDVRTSSMLVGNHTADASSFVELMRYATPWTHALLRVMGPAARERLEQRLTGTLRFSREPEAFRYHLPYSFAVGQRR